MARHAQDLDQRGENNEYRVDDESAQRIPGAVANPLQILVDGRLLEI